MAGTQPGAVVALLDERHLLRRQLDPEIASRHHYAIGKDGVQVLDGLRLFQLGYERNVIPSVRDGLPGAHDILRRPHERQGDHIDRVAANQRSRSASSFSVSEGMLMFVPGRVDPLMLAQSTAVQHLAQNVASAKFIHGQLNAAVGEQNPLSRLNVLREPSVCCRNRFGEYPSPHRR